MVYDVSGGSKTSEVREVYESVCESGATVRYRQLRLRKLETDTNSRRLWEIQREGQYLETIDIAVFRSVSELVRVLDAVAEGKIDSRDSPCMDCPIVTPN